MTSASQDLKTKFDRILIVGPSKTPYMNGLFEFDLWYPLEYPFVPPKMLFRGINSRALNIDPNLRNDGKGESHIGVVSLI
jgi:ubiquitin-protein ligase